MGGWIIFTSVVKLLTWEVIQQSRISRVYCGQVVFKGDSFSANTNVLDLNKLHILIQRYNNRFINDYWVFLSQLTFLKHQVWFWLWVMIKSLLNLNKHQQKNTNKTNENLLGQLMWLLLQFMTGILHSKIRITKC